MNKNATFRPILEDEEHTILHNADAASKSHPGISKSASNRKYGSFSTMLTETNTWSSCSQQSSAVDDSYSVNDNICNNYLGIDDHKLSPSHSRDSSYSDISSDGYYDKFARREWRSQRNSLCTFIENSLMTMHNFKVVVSGLLWFICYMIMGLFGGTVAYLHFQRKDSDVPQPLPDFGYDAIPYYCPNIPHIPHSNVQSVVLFILYTIIVCGAIYRWKPRYNEKSGIIWGGDGRLILQHLFHLNCLIFLTRTTTVGLTGLPQPNPKCVTQQHFEVSFYNALIFVMGRGFPPHSCGDLIYSGHVGCTLICMAVLHKHGFLRNIIAAILTWTVAIIGIYFTISCRSHYSVDVMLAFYFGYGLPEWYFNRSDGRVRGKISRFIDWLEVSPSDLIIDAKDEYLLSVSV
ncbi:hypothetical protein ACHAXN_011967 [Cyclotella atomus]